MSSFISSGLFMCLQFIVIIIVITLMFRLIFAIFAQQQVLKTRRKSFFTSFEVGGHRGAPTIAPENTLESFEKAFNNCVNLLEFDLALSKDGVVVIMHDSDIERTCGEPGLVSSMTVEELSRKNAGKTFYASRDHEKRFHRIPTLEEVIKFSIDRKIKMLFDVKDHSEEMINQIVSLFVKYDLYDVAIVSSFYPWLPYKVKRANPNILTGLTWRPYVIAYANSELTLPRSNSLTLYIKLFFDFIYSKAVVEVLPKFLGVEMLLFHEQYISRKFVKDALNDNFHVVAWPVNNIDQKNYFVNDLSVPILTDVPEMFVRASKDCSPKLD